MALGEILREARLSKGFSEKEVADATNMMVQMVEELEREDFHRIAAPIYGKGFVRLYAELVGLDPGPLVEDFMILYSSGESPSLALASKRRSPAVKPVEPSVQSAPAGEGDVEAAFSAQPPSPQAPYEESSTQVSAEDTSASSLESDVESDDTDPDSTSPSSDLTNGETDLFNYSSTPREQKIRPSLQLGGGREEPKREKNPSKPRRQSTFASDSVAFLKRMGRMIGSVGVLLRVLVKRMPLRDFMVVVVVVVMIIVIAFGARSCIDMHNQSEDPASEAKLKERIIPPPLPYCE